MKTTNKFFRNVSVAMFVIGVLAALSVDAGTYNFYFNNTEQGANSTASPSVVVDPNAGQAKPPVPPAGDTAATTVTLPEQPPAPAAEAPAPAPAQPTNATVAQAPVVTPPRDYPRWQMSLTGGMTFNNALGYGNSTNWIDPSGYEHYSYINNDNENPGGAIALNWNLNRDLSLRFYGGAMVGDATQNLHPYGGLELELRPLHIGIGRFENLIELGAMLGGSSVNRARGNWGTLHAGVRVNLNFGQSWAITTAARGNLGYAMVEAGLQFAL